MYGLDLLGFSIGLFPEPQVHMPRSQVDANRMMLTWIENGKVRASSPRLVTIGILILCDQKWWVVESARQTLRLIACAYRHAPLLACSHMQSACSLLHLLSCDQCHTWDTFFDDGPAMTCPVDMG